MSLLIRTLFAWSVLRFCAPATAVAVAPRLSAVQNKTYDYIIVGGGLSGLVVANRLTENKNGMSPLVPQCTQECTVLANVPSIGSSHRKWGD